MNKTKGIIISVILVFLIIVLVSSSTYAYFILRTNDVGVDTGSGMLDINYSIEPENITGAIISSMDRESGLKAIASVSLKPGSEVASLNMYVTPTSITNLNIDAFKWEVEGINDGLVVYENSGDFSSALEGIPIIIVDGYTLSEAETIFNIYIWLDASLVNSPIAGVNFGAKITADSVNVTGEF